MTRRERNWDECEAVVDRIRGSRGARRDRIPPNPPPKKIGKVDPKTICRRAVSDLIDCGSWKTQGVMQVYIDFANRSDGRCYPSEATVARVLRLHDPQAVKRANRWWLRSGYLSIDRRGRRRPDGTREANAYRVHWLRLIELVAERHWDDDLRAEARAVLDSQLIKSDRQPGVKSDPLIQGNYKSRVLEKVSCGN